MKPPNLLFYGILLFSFLLSCEEIIPPKQPYIENFSVSPLGTWHVDDVVTLNWTVKYADSVSIDNGIGTVPPTGTYQYTLTTPGSFNFVLTASNSAGSADKIIPYSVEFIQFQDVWGKWISGISEAEPHNIIKCLNGYILLIGTTGYYTGDPSSNVLVSRIDTNGNKIWEKYFRRGDGCSGESAAEMPDGSFIIAANNHYNKPPQNDYLFYLLHISSDGDLIWEKNLGGYYIKTSDCAALHDEYYLITGESYDLDGNPYLKQLYIGKFRNLKPVWEKTFSTNGPAESESSGRRILKTSDGGYAVLGTIWTKEQEEDIYLIKVDGNGSLEWQKTFGKAAPLNEYGKDFLECKEGGFIVLGHTYEQGNGDIYIIKTDSSGNMEWEMKQGSEREDTPVSLIEYSNGGYLASWNTSAESEGSDADIRLNIIKFDAEGKTFWQASRLYYVTNCHLATQRIIETGNKEFIILLSGDCIACCPHFGTYTYLEKVRIF